MTPGYSLHPDMTPGYPFHPDMTPGYSLHPDMTPGYPLYPDMTPGYPFLPDMTPGYPFHPDMTPGFPLHPKMTSEYPLNPDMTSGHPFSPGSGYPLLVTPSNHQLQETCLNLSIRPHCITYPWEQLLVTVEGVTVSTSRRDASYWSAFLLILNNRKILQYPLP